MARPWMKFYPVDWRADPRLRMCSLAARGLWIDLMTYMHEGEPYGHLTIDGVATPTNSIAALVGRPVNEVGKALAELEARGVFDRAASGGIVSRRMVRDKVKADQDRANGKGGGNPNLRAPDNTGVNPADNAAVGGEDKAQTPDARVQKPETESVRARGARYAADFEEKFWQPYPRTPVMSKEEAWKAWRKLTDAEQAAAIAAVPRYAAWLRARPDHPTVHAVRFIAQRRFDGFGEPEQSADMTGTRIGGKVFVAAESPEAAAWAGHLASTGGNQLPAGRNGWWLDSRWPPSDPRSVT